MRLKALIAGVSMAAILATSGSSAYAQSHTNQNKQTQKNVKKSVQVVVNPGDTLSGIAGDHQVTYQRLYDANTSVDNPDLIFPGQKIRVPGPSEQLAHRELPANAAAQAAVAPAAQPAASTTPAAATKPVVQAAPVIQASAVAGCGDNQYANFIYSHESGCRTTASSGNGCYGIGQACPASKIAYCGADYDCQNAYFTAYAARYGGWAGAYDFWVSHGWW